MSLLEGLIHWWELDTTDWLDSHGSWNLTPQKDSGGSDPSINATGGPDGGPCLSLDRTNYLDRTNVAWDGIGGARSIQIWVFQPVVSLFQYRHIISHRGGGAATTVYNHLCSSGIARVGFGDNTTYVTFGETIVSPNVWYHCLLATNGVDRHRLYLNGELNAESNTTLTGGVSRSPQPFAIGTYSENKTSTQYRLTGLACLAGVWEREITSSEVARLYRSGAGLRYADLGTSVIPLLRYYHRQMKD